MIHFNERLPRTDAERDLIEAAALLTESMTAEEMDAMEREIEAERAVSLVAPCGPITGALYGKQDMAAFFERGVALMDTPDPETDRGASRVTMDAGAA